jgi:hypothetical protein
MIRHVTTIAAGAYVRALESVSSLAVIEDFEIPLRQHEIFAVVF